MKYELTYIYIIIYILILDMKNISDYINEALETEKSHISGYRNIILTRRENVDCANISEEDFCKFITEDIKLAAKIYDEENAEQDAKNAEERLEKRKKQIIDYANKRYKRESNRKKFIDAAIAIENLKENPFKHTLTFVDFDVTPWENGISNACILHPDKIEEEAPICYKEIKDNKYFKRATGWVIKYAAMEGSVTAAFRPFIELIGDDLLKDEMEQDRERLKASIEKFYSKSDYWGD